MNKRLKTYFVNTTFFAHCFLQTTNGRSIKIEGVPETAKLFRVYHSNNRDCIGFTFEDASFDEVQEAQIIPEGTITISIVTNEQQKTGFREFL